MKLNLIVRLLSDQLLGSLEFNHSVILRSSFFEIQVLFLKINK